MSAGNEERRPSGEMSGDQTSVVGDDTPNDTASAAFGHGFELGAGHGWDIGWHAGYKERSDEYDAMLTGIAPVFAQPRQAELDRIRTALRNCACGRCSACCRRAAIARNRQRYGSDDYPGRVAC